MDVFRKNGEWYVYIYHFSKPHRHCNHYVGMTQNLKQRNDQHCTGVGHGLTNSVLQKGGTLTLATVIQVSSEQEARELEKLIKRQKNTKRFCSMCSSRCKFLEKRFSIKAKFYGGS